MYTIRKADKGEAAVIQRLGTDVYLSTYSTILSRAQIDFMLEKSYTPQAIQQAMVNGQDFYLLFKEETEALGFIAIENNNAILRIEKLYLLEQCQGLGLGKMLVDFAVGYAKELGCSIAELNVNRANKAYHFYLKQGFQVVREVDMPYYDYILDDYVMQKLIL